MNEPKYKVGEVYKWHEEKYEDYYSICFIKILSVKEQRASYVYSITSCNPDGEIIDTVIENWSEFHLNQKRILPILEWKKQYINDKFKELEVIKTLLMQLEKHTTIDLNMINEIEEN